MNVSPATHVSSSPLLDEARATARLLGAPDRLLDVGHAQVAYTKLGRGPDVVCVHGWPLHGATFRRVAPVLAERFTLHVIDLPGTGRSVWDARSRIGLGAHADTVRRVTELLGLERFAYLAHDSGAAITRLAAADDPRVFAMVMGNTEIPGHVPWQITAFVLAAKVPIVWRAFLGSMRLGPIRRSSLGFGGCFTDPRYVDGAFGEIFLRPLFRDRRVLDGQTQLVHHLDPELVHGLRETHRRIAAPTLMVWGPDDPFFPLAGAREMAPQLAGGAELVEIPGGKLFVHEDRAGEFAEATRDFLLRRA